MKFYLQNSEIDIHPHRQELIRADAGGYCSFEGWVRNHHKGREVSYLEYQSYDSLAIREGELIVQEAINKFSILDARVIHRIGRIDPTELAVWIGVTAVHRAEAFDACRYLIDTIKVRVPIWKHEFYSDGCDEWVYCCGCHS